MADGASSNSYQLLGSEVRKQRPYMVLFTKCDGQPWQSGPYTKLEAERRIRNTHWGYRADPRIVRVK